MRCNYCGVETKYNTCSEDCRRANNKMMARGNFANQSAMREALNNGEYFPKPTKSLAYDIAYGLNNQTHKDGKVSQ